MVSISLNHGSRYLEKDIKRMIRWTVGLGIMVFAVSAAHAQDGDASKTPLRPTYYTCVKASRGVTLALNNCIGNEYDFQDKRLNTVYQRLRASLPPEQRTTLRDDERAWITKRDTTCAPDGSGGTASMLDSNQCHLDQTAARAAVLEARAGQ
jgi:uncharacterized protein YecT (DUF1311 family)